MKLRIDDITAAIKELDFTETQDEINRLLEKGPIREYRLEAPVSVHLSYYRSGMELFFEGDLKAKVQATCARCAEDFDVTNQRGFRFVLVPRVVGDDAKADLRVEDLEFSTYEGEDVDLSPLIREQTLLGLPTRPLCQEDCRGLCPVCGNNLNSTKCDCRMSIPDPRLVVLRSLKLQRPAR